MAKISAIGAQVLIGTALGSNTNVTAATNAASGVFTAAGLGAAVNDYVVVSASGWQRLQDRVFRVSNVATNDFTLLNADTSDTVLFPAGGGVGSTLNRVTTWTSIAADVENFEVTGGDPQYAGVTGLADLIEIQIPTRRSAMTINIPFFYDASLAWLGTVRTASNSQAKRPVRLSNPNGMQLTGHGFINFLDAPTIQDTVYRGVITFALGNITTAYATAS